MASNNSSSTTSTTGPYVGWQVSYGSAPLAVSIGVDQNPATGQATNGYTYITFNNFPSTDAVVTVTPMDNFITYALYAAAGTPGEKNSDVTGTGGGGGSVVSLELPIGNTYFIGNDNIQQCNYTTATTILATVYQAGECNGGGNNDSSSPGWKYSVGGGGGGAPVEYDVSVSPGTGGYGGLGNGSKGGKGTEDAAGTGGGSGEINMYDGQYFKYYGGTGQSTADASAGDGAPSIVVIYYKAT